jgi:hypothetical protein
MSNRIGIGIDVFGAGIDANAQTIYNRIIADGGVSNLTRLNFFVKGLKAIYGDLANVPVCYDAHWIGYKLGSGTGATAGQAAAKLYSLTVAGDAVQATAASQPLLLAHNGNNYAWFPKVSGNYINSTTTYATSDIDFEFSIESSVTSSGVQQVVGTNNTSIFSILINRTSNLIILEYESGGYKSCNAPFTRAATNIIRVTRNSATGAVTFINNGVTLTTSGTQAAGALDGTITSLCVGGYTAGYPFEGKINNINCYISGVLTRTFNPATYNASTSQTQWTSTTGEIWTISTGTAASGYKGVLVDRTMVMSDGTDDFITSSTITSISNRTNYLGVITWATVNANYFMDGNLVASNGILTTIQPGIGINNGGTAYAIYTQQRKLSTTKLSGTTLGASINNGTETTGTSVVPLSFTSVVLGRAGNGAASINSVFLTVAISNSADDTTNRTAMYNLIRSLNNNAF